MGTTRRHWWNQVLARSAIGVLLAISGLAIGQASGADAASESAPPHREIDRRLSEFWQEKAIRPAALATAEVLLRRVSLDLLGRTPTDDERQAWLARKEPLDERYNKLVDELLDGSEFPLYWGTVLDEIVQGAAAGNVEFQDYLRRRLRQRTGWDAIFREVMLGPWNADDAKPALRFLDGRVKDLDRLTTDVTRAFFGVDISCARCHDHPLVADWRQEHYYGMASFFNRTSGGKGSVVEKFDGDVTYKAHDGQQRTAALMFLDGRKIEEPGAEEAKRVKFSRREQLVRAALDDRRLLASALVNRVWAQLLGRGLVSPVDQLHSANPSSIPGLLEWLAEDFVASGYDVRRLIGGIVRCQAYRVSSERPEGVETVDEGQFAAFRLRLLAPRAYAMALVLTTGQVRWTAPDPLAERAARLTGGGAGATRIAQYLQAEQLAAPLLAQLDPAHDGQSSTNEALYLSNHPAVQALFRAEGKSLSAELAAIPNDEPLVTMAVRRAYGREPTENESAQLAEWFRGQSGTRASVCERLTWALLTSAEFRYQH